jgi:hypothetical protein
MFGFTLILGVASQAQSIHDLFRTERFHRAYFDRATNEVTFDPFQELDWEAKARAALPWLNLERPTSSQIARLSSSESAGPQFRSIEFRAVLDTAVSRPAYLLVSARDIVQIQPVELKGSVNFYLDSSMTNVVRRVVSGVIVAKASRARDMAAFVLVGKPADVSNVHPDAGFREKNQPGPPVFEFLSRGQPVSWTASSSDRPEAASALSFRLMNRQLLLVKWKQESCGSAYTLFGIDKALTPIAGNEYDCDP